MSKAKITLQYKDHKWFLVADDALESQKTWRMRVPGGWLYRYGGRMCFVPWDFSPRFQPARQGD